MYYRKPILWMMFLPFVLGSCATYYQTNREFNRYFESGNLKSAQKTLLSNQREANGRERFLYFLNMGVVASLKGQYELSNEYFEKAYLFGEDNRITAWHEIASVVANPNIVVYKGEDHEHLMLLYYKALNYMKLEKYNEALVECRRLNLRLQQLSDRYKSENRYRRDAFVHNLMGIIYDADRDFNNAFIAYRNAYIIYQEDYKDMFNVEVPEQLKFDLLRSAWRSGFFEDFERYRMEFQMPDYRPQDDGSGELVFFWNNGMGPVKSETSINFVMAQSGGFLNITNDDFGYNFPFQSHSISSDELSSLSDLRVFRMAIPRYTERPLMYSGGKIVHNRRVYTLDLGEDVNAIAFKSMQERMLAEFGKSLLRVAIRKAAEHQLRKENEGLGAAFGLLTSMTERADTRNWQTLPHSIYYTRVPMEAGENTIKFIKEVPGRPNLNKEYKFTYSLKSGETIFHTFTSLETAPRYDLLAY